LFKFVFKKAQKVNLKIKNINSQVLTRTKTLNHYTNDANVIFDAAKNLLLNEINLNNNKMRLIGVRVSALRDELDNRKFFINTHNDDEFENNEFDYKNDLFINCPICNEYFEGNEEYIQQHIEFCMFT